MTSPLAHQNLANSFLTSPFTYVRINFCLLVFPEQPPLKCKNVDIQQKCRCTYSKILLDNYSFRTFPCFNNFFRISNFIKSSFVFTEVIQVFLRTFLATESKKEIEIHVPFLVNTFLFFKKHKTKQNSLSNRGKQIK